ncbi:MAG: hypothetical protein ABTQ28_00760, partial [Thauera sp.]
SMRAHPGLRKDGVRGALTDFLTGKIISTGRPPFELDLEWIVSPANFVKIIEGKYHREAAA